MRHVFYRLILLAPIKKAIIIYKHFITYKNHYTIHDVFSLVLRQNRLSRFVFITNT